MERRMGSGLKKNPPSNKKDGSAQKNIRSSTAVRQRAENCRSTEENYIMEGPQDNTQLGATLDKMALESMMDDVIKRKKAQFKYEIHWNKDALPKETNISKHLLVPYKAVVGSAQAAKGMDKGGHRSTFSSDKKASDSVGQRLCRSNIYKENTESKKGMRNTYLDEKGVYDVIMNRRKSWSKVCFF